MQQYIITITHTTLWNGLELCVNVILCEMFISYYDLSHIKNVLIRRKVVNRAAAVVIIVVGFALIVIYSHTQNYFILWCDIFMKSFDDFVEVFRD